jgi:DNA polymerase-3 subunit alpha
MFAAPNDDILESDIGMYTNLHAHSIYSPLDGFAKIDDYVDRAKKLGMKGVCFSDHGNQFAAFELWKSCNKHGMKPIFANETYIAPQSALVKEKVDGYKPAYHVLLIAMNDIGYANLMKLTSWSWIEGKYYKPRVDFSKLAQYNEGIICLSACIGGYAQQMHLEGRDEEAEDVANAFKAIFGDRYYFEMTYTGMEEQDSVNKFLKKLSKKLDIPLVITCDSHYTYKHESEYHHALVTINTGGSLKKKVDDNSKGKDGEADTDDSSMFYTPGEYYLKPYHILTEYFKDEDDIKAFENTNKIADMCSVNFEVGKTIYPQLVEDSDEFLRVETHKYLSDYIKDFSEEEKTNYINRLDYELDIISKMQFSGYFIVVADYIQHAKKNGILVGPARGSGAGSLATYCMGITHVDPIKYGLLFGRMLNRGRAKLPIVELPGYPMKDYM